MVDRTNISEVVYRTIDSSSANDRRPRRVNSPARTSAKSFKLRVSGVLGVLILANISIWGLALQITGAYPVLVGSAVLAYGLGLRHAFDADHIAAIDNVTRRLVASGQRPAGVGFFFSLGHSSVVFVATVGIALAAGQIRNRFALLQNVLGPFGTAFSSLFLLAVAGLNILVFLSVWRSIQRQRGGPDGSSDAETIGPAGGFFSRRLDRIVRRISRSWLMYPLGVVFALGFDTASEVGLLGLAAAQAAKGLPLWSILIFPALFAAGMALADTLEALFMLGAYQWTSTRPKSRLYYNLAATAASILAGVIVAMMQLAGLAPRASTLLWPLTAAADFLSQRSEWVGLIMVVGFAVLWGGWILRDRVQGSKVGRA